MKKLKRRKGFTLIELIVVIAVLGILAVVAVPKYNGMKDKAREAVDKETVVSLQKAVDLYYVENDDYPDTEGELDKAVKLVFESNPKPEQAGMYFGLDTDSDNENKIVIYDGTDKKIIKID